MTVFIQKGDAPMFYRQAVKRGLRYFEAEKAYWEREAGLLMGSQAYIEWANQWMKDNQENAANNAFNVHLWEYRAAVARLAQYRLADGRPEVYEDQPTGAFDDAGNAIMESVLVQAAIAPLDATVEQPAFDAEGVQIGTETVPNPLIVQDDAERAAAQAVIDATPQEVKDFD